MIGKHFQTEQLEPSQKQNKNCHKKHFWNKSTLKNNGHISTPTPQFIFQKPQIFFSTRNASFCAWKKHFSKWENSHMGYFFCKTTQACTHLPSLFQSKHSTRMDLAKDVKKHTKIWYRLHKLKGTLEKTRKWNHRFFLARNFQMFSKPCSPPINNNNNNNDNTSFLYILIL